MASNYGQARSLPSLSHTCMAAQKRICLWEDNANGGLAVNSKHSQLQAACSESDHLDRFIVWHDWYINGPIATLFCNSNKLAGMGLGSREVLHMAGWDAIDSNDREKGVRRVKKQTQKVTRLAIANHDLPNAEGRIRKKMARWKLAGLPRVTATRCTRLLKDLSRLVPPRVSAAVWRTMWNGWTTDRRFSVSGHRCLLGCDSVCNEDSIEHYARCAVTRRLALQFLGLPIPHYSFWLGNFVALGVNHRYCDDAVLTRRAALVYSIYRTTNHLRHHPTSDAQFIMDMAQQYVREAVRGHPKATTNLEKHVQLPGSVPGG